MLTLDFRILLILQLALLLCTNLYGQTPYPWEWAEEAYTNNTEFANDVAVDPISGDIVVVGEFTGDISAFYGPDFVAAVGGGFVAKYNSAGTLQWAFRIGGNNDDRCKGVAIDAAGNVYVTGYMANIADFRGNSPGPNVLTSDGGRDVFLAKYTSAGMYLWAKQGGGASDDEGLAVCINTTSVFVTGYYHDVASFGPLLTFSSNNNDNAFVVAYDLNGNEQWLTDIGANNHSYGYDIIADNSNVFVIGDFEGNLTIFGPSAIIVGSVIAGSSWESFAIGISTTGVFAWVSVITGNNQQHCYSVAEKSANIYITGSIDNSSTFSGFSANPVIPTGSGKDMYVAQLRKNDGATQWVNCETGSGDQEGMHISTTGNNDIVVTGYLKTDLTFSTGPTILAVGNEDIFVAQYSNNGIFVWANSAGGSDKDIPYGIASLTTGIVYVVGEYQGAATFGTLNLFNENTINIFVAKLGCPAITNNLISAAQTICTGQTPAILSGSVPTGGSAPYIYLWEESPDNIIWSPASGTNNTQNYSPPSLVASTYYRRRVTSTGGCSNFSTSASILITIDPLPTPASAGVDQTLCASSTSLLGNTPTTGNGTWTLVSGSGTITTPSSPTSGITAMSPGANIFQWTITSGTCPASSDQVTINVDPMPTVAAAGVDQTLCSSSASLLGNTPTAGSGTWTLVSGSGTITTPSSPTSGITAMSPGANIFQWTITSGTCPASSDQVTINVDPLPTTASAGVDQTLCAASTSLLGNTPSTGNGTWTLVSGSGTITTPSSPTSGITAMSPGANIFQWTITSGTCPASSDQVTINVDPMPTVAAAGVDQTLCASSTSLLGNTPTTGSGTWTLVSGSGTITTPSAPTSGITAMSPGANIFQWTIISGTCPASLDSVIINVDAMPTVANAGTDQTLCSSSAVFAGNTPLIGNGDWTLISGTGTPTIPTFEGSAVTALSVGSNSFQWEISNGTCPSSLDTVIINVDAMPTVATAGPDQTLCSSSTTLAGNAALVGNATWTLLSGSGTITTPTLETSGVTTMNPGANVFVWMISNGTCPSSTDTVTVNVDSIPTVANAGPDQTLCSSSVTLAGNPAVTGNGLWSLVSGTGTLTTPTVAACGITAMLPGANVFEWRIANGTCPSSADTVIINVDAMPTVAAAGVDQTLCASSTSLLGNTPTTGNGTWTLVSGSGTITTPSSPTSGVTAMSPGANIFQWTITNGTCPASTDTVIIVVDAMPTAANAGADQLLCSSITSLSGNTPAIGNGTWTLLTGTGNVLSPNLESSIVTTLSPGANTFQWSIANGTCPASIDTVIIDVETPPSVADAGLDQEVDHPFFTLHANTPVYGTGHWEVVSGSITLPDPANPNCSVGDMPPGVYVFRWVISGIICDSTTDEVTITVNEFLIPTGFSPNQDGINDYFVIPGVGYWDNFDLSIYNRWGQLVYQKAGYQNEWNGQNQNGEALVDDTYYYTLNIPAVNKYTGFVVIKRE